MPINQMLLPEYEMEMALTRKTIERLPADKWDWKPHDKSFSLGDLASHVANIPNWGVVTMQTEEYDVAPPGEEPPSPAVAHSPQEAVALLDKGVAELKHALTEASDDALMQIWTMKKTGEVLFSMPRLSVIRSFILNHLIHHRAQLSLYLRMLDMPMPSIYGPTADES